MQLHIITGDHALAKKQAQSLQATEPDLDYLVYDSISTEGLAGHLKTRNVIWVNRDGAPIHVTTSHCVALPKAFGSVVSALVASGAKRRLFVLTTSGPFDYLRWHDEDGEPREPQQLLEPTVLFDAKEA